MERLKVRWVKYFDIFLIEKGKSSCWIGTSENGGKREGFVWRWMRVIELALSNAEAV